MIDRREVWCGWRSSLAVKAVGIWIDEIKEYKYIIYRIISHCIIASIHFITRETLETKFSFPFLSLHGVSLASLPFFPFLLLRLTGGEGEGEGEDGKEEEVREDLFSFEIPILRARVRWVRWIG